MITAGSLIDSVSRRVRDSNNTAHTRAFVRDIVDRLQVILNAKQQYVFTETIYTAAAGQTLYSVENDLGSTIEVTEVSIDGRELDRQNWRNLHRISPTWLTDRADTPIAWAPIGRSLIAIYPAPSNPIDITFRGPKITTPINDDDIPLDLRDEDSDLLRELTTAILLIRQRDLDTVPSVIQRIAQKMGLQLKENQEM